MQRVVVLLVCALALAMAACAGPATEPEGLAEPAPDPPPEPPAAADEAAEPAPEDPAAPASGDGGEPEGGEPEGPDPSEIGANELGLVPVLMYHRLLPGGGGEYDLTPEEFRAELSRLHEEGYRPVRLTDVIHGELDIPAGTSPVVLTFDDATREQAALDDGDIAADTAIGILLDFAAAHPEFPAVASLFVNAGPFGGGADSGDIMRRLHELGFELGNHTHGHARLDRLDADEVRRELARGVAAINDAVPGADVTTLSLPFGIWPEPRDLAYEGEWEGTSFHHEGILLVGAGPAPSPFDGEFDALAIPRIRSAPWQGGDPDYASGYWLDWLAEHPDRRYVSDGDPSRISFPRDQAERLAPEHADRANPY